MNRKVYTKSVTGHITIFINDFVKVKLHVMNFRSLVIAENLEIMLEYG